MNPFIIGFALASVLGLGVATWKAPRLTSALIWSLVAAITLSAVVAKFAPVPRREAIMFMVMSVSITWAGLQFWCYWLESKWRVLASLFVVSGLSAAVIFLV